MYFELATPHATEKRYSVAWFDMLWYGMLWYQVLQSNTEDQRYRTHCLHYQQVKIL